MDVLYIEYHQMSHTWELSFLFAVFYCKTVCLDGTLPGYHLHSGYGSGANSWLIQLEVWHLIQVVDL